MKKSRKHSAYKDAKPFFKTRKRPGVYIVYKDNVVVYVGYSSTDVYKTMYRHFQQWTDRQQIRITYQPNDQRIKVRVIYTNTAKQAARLEYGLILKLQPTDNPQQYLPAKYDTPEIQNVITEAEDIITFNGPDPF